MKRNVLLFALLALIQTFLFSQSGEIFKHPFTGRIVPEGPQRPLISNSGTARSSGTKQVLDSIKFKIWDQNIGNWTNDSWHIFTYDDSAYAETGLFRFWDSDQNDWLDGSFEEYVYNADGQIEETIYSYWDTTAAQWDTFYKLVYNYNPDGTKDEILFFSWDDNNSVWTLTGKDTFSYSGNTITIISSYWDSSTSSWDFESKEEQTYDALGNTVLVLYYFWDYDGNTWVKNKKREYTYDMTAGVIVRRIYNWQANLANWVPQLLDSMSVDLTTGAIVEDVIFVWNQNIGSWEFSSKVELTYDPTYTFDDLGLFPNYYFFLYLDNFWTRILTNVSTYGWNSNFGVWVPHLTIDFYYSEKVVTSSSDLYEGEARVMPNPTVGELIFDVPQNSEPMQLRCFDLQGRLVQTSSVVSGQAVDVSDLQAGVYIYVLRTDEGGIFRGKFVKE